MIGRIGLTVMGCVLLAACGSIEPVVSAELATPTLPEATALPEPATPTLPEASFTTPPMSDPSATQVPDADPYGEQPVPPQVGVLQLAESKSQWAPDDVVAIAYTDPDELASTRSPSYTVHPLVDGEIQGLMYAEFAGNADRAPIWSPPDDLPEAVTDDSLSGVGEDLVLLPPTIPDGTYVICNANRPVKCTDPLIVAGG